MNWYRSQNINKSLEYSSNLGTADDPFEIWNWNDLLYYSMHDIYWSKSMIQMADVQCPYQYNEFMPIRLYGDYNGNNKKITGLYIDINSWHTDNGFYNHKVDYAYDGAGGAGLFDVVDYGGTVESLSLVDCTVKNTDGLYRAGAIVGENFGIVSKCKISNCTVEAHQSGGIAARSRNSGQINDCAVTVTTLVTGEKYTGGIVGCANGGHINRCIASCNVIANSTDGMTTGGLVGFADNCTINDCASQGNVTINGFLGYYTGGFIGEATACSITNSYSTSTMFDNTENSSTFGGFAGHSYQTSFTSCYWNSQTSGVASSDGGTELLFFALINSESYISSYVGWDSEVWRFEGSPLQKSIIEL